MPGTNTPVEKKDAVVMVATAPGVFNKEQCDHIISLSENIASTQGTVGPADDKTDARKANIRFMVPGSENAWLFKRLNSAVEQLNDAYKFDLAGFNEGVQISTYTPGNHYDWHIDLGPGKNSSRKLSLSVQLTDASEYEGGELEFMNLETTIPKEIGSLIVFPSFMMHRVCPVTSGTRKSLVSWIHGNPFR